jgi:hypothetical protein
MIVRKSSHVPFAVAFLMFLSGCQQTYHFVHWLKQTFVITEENFALHDLATTPLPNQPFVKAGDFNADKNYKNYKKFHAGIIGGFNMEDKPSTLPPVNYDIQFVAGTGEDFNKEVKPSIPPPVNFDNQFVAGTSEDLPWQRGLPRQSLPQARGGPARSSHKSSNLPFVNFNNKFASGFREAFSKEVKPSTPTPVNFDAQLVAGINEVVNPTMRDVLTVEIDGEMLQVEIPDNDEEELIVAGINEVVKPTMRDVLIVEIDGERLQVEIPDNDEDELIVHPLTVPVANKEKSWLSTIMQLLEMRVNPELFEPFSWKQFHKPIMINDKLHENNNVVTVELDGEVLQVAIPDNDEEQLTVQLLQGQTLGDPFEIPLQFRCALCQRLFEGEGPEECEHCKCFPLCSECGFMWHGPGRCVPDPLFDGFREPVMLQNDGGDIPSQLQEEEEVMEFQCQPCEDWGEVQSPSQQDPDRCSFCGFLGCNPGCCYICWSNGCDNCLETLPDNTRRCGWCLSEPTPEYLSSTPLLGAQPFSKHVVQQGSSQSKDIGEIFAIDFLVEGDSCRPHLPSFSFLARVCKFLPPAANMGRNDGGIPKGPERPEYIIPWTASCEAALRSRYNYEEVRGYPTATPEQILQRDRVILKGVENLSQAEYMTVFKDLQHAERATLRFHTKSLTKGSHDCPLEAIKASKWNYHVYSHLSVAKHVIRLPEIKAEILQKKEAAKEAEKERLKKLDEEAAAQARAQETERLKKVKEEEDAQRRKDAAQQKLQRKKERRARDEAIQKFLQAAAQGQAAGQPIAVPPELVKPLVPPQMIELPAKAAQQGVAASIPPHAIDSDEAVGIIDLAEEAAPKMKPVPNNECNKCGIISLHGQMVRNPCEECLKEVQGIPPAKRRRPRMPVAVVPEAAEEESAQNSVHDSVHEEVLVQEGQSSEESGDSDEEEPPPSLPPIP